MFDHITYESLVMQVEEYQRFRSAAQPDTEVYARIVDNERALREVLAARPEHKAAQEAWRKRSGVVVVINTNSDSSSDNSGPPRCA